MAFAPIRWPLKLVQATLLSVVLLLAGGAAMAAPGDVGTPAADFTLQVYGGGTETLSDYAGKVRMLFIMGYS